MLTFDGVWQFGEVFSSWMNPGVYCIRQMPEGRTGQYGKKYDYNILYNTNIYIIYIILYYII